MELKEPIYVSKLHDFQTFPSRNTKHTGHKNVKIEACVLANFSKTAERNKTPFTGNQVRLKLRSNQQTDQKSVHSTRRYFKIKVQYQMSFFDSRDSRFAKIDPQNLEKRGTIYIWWYSPSNGQSKTLSFIIPTKKNSPFLCHRRNSRKWAKIEFRAIQSKNWPTQLNKTTYKIYIGILPTIWGI